MYVEAEIMDALYDKLYIIIALSFFQVSEEFLAAESDCERGVVSSNLRWMP